MRKISGITALVVAGAVLLGACGGPASAGEVGGSVPSEVAETVAPAVAGPVEIAVRWEPLPDTFADANALVQAITMGWNLGNTLDSNVGTSAVSIRNNSPQRQETHWSNAITTEDMILMVRDAGFNAIRIPVTWFSMVDEDLNIRDDWMNRVQEVVDYAYDNGLIVILNSHHDESMWSLFDEGRDDSVAVIAKLWEQISDRFAGYGQRLVFEGLNEPRTVGSPNEWTGGTAEERNNLNILTQVFVDTVRATGGNNAERFLIASPYGASASEAATQDLVIPVDPAGPGKIIVSIHNYAPYPFALYLGDRAVDEWSVDGVGDSGPDTIIEGLENAYELFVSQGYPVIIGEMAAINRNNLESRIAWSRFYVEEARKIGIRTFWWDNGGTGITLPGIATDHYALFNRRRMEPSQPEIINAIMEAVDATS
ncbi:MAG: glycoside hydrolase family 5 protein [Cellulomonadaceae bacterium]|jgi:endoglucanase|nr:glycoside hydrolase family 5 protein [Cellulomonadaceae bacterium]